MLGEIIEGGGRLPIVVLNAEVPLHLRYTAEDS